MSTDIDKDPEKEIVINVPEYKRQEVPEEFQKTCDTLEGLMRIDVPRFMKEYERLLSVQDPVKDPYRSRYLACDTVLVLRKKLETFLESETDEARKEDIRQEMAQIDYLVGAVELDTEELGSGENHMKQAVEVLEERYDLNIINFNI